MVGSLAPSLAIDQPLAVRDGGFSGLGHADDADGEPAAGVAGGLGLQVVGLLMDDQAAADDRVSAVEAQMCVIQVEGGIAVRVGRDVAQVADVPLRCCRARRAAPWRG